MTWVDIANLKGPRGEDGRDGDQGPMGPVNIGLRQEDPITYDQQGGFTFNLVDGTEQTVNLPIASAQSAGLLAAGGRLPTTGRREIASLAEAASGGSVVVSRTGDFVELRIYALVPAGAVSTSLIQVFGSTGFPSGFRPTDPLVFGLATTSPLGPTMLARTYLSGGRLDINNPGQPVYGVVVYRTGDSWPSPLPGTAV